MRWRRRVRSGGCGQLRRLAFICQIDGDPPGRRLHTRPPRATPTGPSGMPMPGASTWTYSQSGGVEPPPAARERRGVGIRGRPVGVGRLPPSPETAAPPPLPARASRRPTSATGAAPVHPGHHSGSDLTDGRWRRRRRAALDTERRAAYDLRRGSAGQPPRSPPRNDPAPAINGSTGPTAHDPATASRATAPGLRRTTTQGKRASSAPQSRMQRRGRPRSTTI